MTCEFDLALIEKTLDQRDYDSPELVGTGSSAYVYKVHSRRYDCQFAVKVSPLAGEFSYQNENEVAALKRLWHPNIIRMYDNFTDSRYRYVVLDFCETSLHDILASSGPLLEPKLISFIRQICDAVQFCHSRGIVHLDIKPANILLDRYGRPQLADFGLSRICEPGSICEDRKGSLVFMAPEVLAGSKFDPFKADVWSTGITLFALATGDVPWTDYSDIKSTISRGVTELQLCRARPSVRPILKAMLTLDPLHRPDIRTILMDQRLLLEHPLRAWHGGGSRICSLSHSKRHARNVTRSHNSIALPIPTFVN